MATRNVVRKPQGSSAGPTRTTGSRQRPRRRSASATTSALAVTWRGRASTWRDHSHRTVGHVRALTSSCSYSPYSSPAETSPCPAPNPPDRRPRRPWDTTARSRTSDPAPDPVLVPANHRGRPRIPNEPDVHRMARCEAAWQLEMRHSPVRGCPGSPATPQLSRRRAPVGSARIRNLVRRAPRKRTPAPPLVPRTPLRAQGGRRSGTGGSTSPVRVSGE